MYNTFIESFKILQELGVVQASATERWPQKVEKSQKIIFFVKNKTFSLVSFPEVGKKQEA